MEGRSRFRCLRLTHWPLFSSLHLLMYVYVIYAYLRTFRDETNDLTIDGNCGNATWSYVRCNWSEMIGMADEETSRVSGWRTVTTRNYNIYYIAEDPSSRIGVYNKWVINRFMSNRIYANAEKEARACDCLIRETEPANTPLWAKIVRLKKKTSAAELC